MKLNSISEMFNVTVSNVAFRYTEINECGSLTYCCCQIKKKSVNIEINIFSAFSNVEKQSYFKMIMFVKGFSDQRSSDSVETNSVHVVE